jgi:hypothetical protein
VLIENDELIENVPGSLKLIKIDLRKTAYKSIFILVLSAKSNLIFAE